MTSLSLPFTQSEYDRRLEKTRKAMQQAGIDILFIEDPSNISWLTGYEGWSFYVHQGVLVTLDDVPYWWGRSQDAQGAKLTVYMDNQHIHGYDDHYVQSPHRHPMEDLAQLIKHIGHQESRLAVEMDNYYFSAQAYLVLKEKLPKAKMVDSKGLVNWQRGIKSREEIAFMDKAARISEKIITKVIETAKPGIKKNNLVAEIYATAIRGEGNIWGDYPAIVPLLPSGVNASAPHLTWNGDTLKSGEGTFIEISGCYRRYHVPLCRTLFLGKPTSQFLEAEKALAEGIENGIDIARPGAKASDVANKLHEALEKRNIKRSGRCGYSIGISYPPDWGERTISFRKEDDSILEAGMTFHFMPGLWMSTWGLEITESIEIMQNGPARCFTNMPRKIFVID